MNAVRQLLHRRGWAAALLAATLALRLLVPGGYMLDAGRGPGALVPCSGVMAMPAAHSHHGAPGDHGGGKAEMPCAFAGLSAALLGPTKPPAAAAPVLLAPTPYVSPGVPRPHFNAPRLRPPLRGPPALA